MPDADVIKSPTHTSPWTDGDTAAAVYVCPAGVVSLPINHHSLLCGRRCGGRLCSTRYQTLDITQSVCMSVVYYYRPDGKHERDGVHSPGYQVTDMEGRGGVCGVAETPVVICRLPLVCFRLC